jgi:WD40 repeat protein
MRRREFLGASAILLTSGARVIGEEKSAVKPREPDHVIKGHGGYIAFSPNSKMLAVASGPIGDEYGICFLDPDNGKRLPDFERTTDIKVTRGHGRPPVLIFSPDGKYFAAGGQGYVAIWETASGRRLTNIDPVEGEPTGTVTSLLFAPDSNRLLLGYYFRPIHNPDEHEKIEGLEGYDGLAFSADGELLATRLQGLITLWQYPRLKKQTVFGKKQPTGGPLIFSPDRGHIVSREVEIDGRAHYLWNTNTGEPKYVPFEIRLAFNFDLSRDGSLVAGVSQTGIALLQVSDGRAAFWLDDSAFRGRKKSINENPQVAIKFAPSQQIVALSHVSGIQIWKDKDGFNTS